MRVNKNACYCLLVSLALGCTPKNVVTVKTGTGAVRLEVVSPEIVRVSAARDGKFSDRQSLAVLPQEGCTDFEVSEAMGVVHLTTKALAMDIYKADGSMRFYDLRPGSRKHSCSWHGLLCKRYNPFKRQSN